MSAYMVDLDDIQIVVSAAANRGIIPTHTEATTALGRALIEQNLASIHARYPDTVTDPSGIPGPAFHYWAHAYHYTYTAADARTIAETLSRYEYQSCETPYYSDSGVSAVVEAIRSTLSQSAR